MSVAIRSMQAGDVSDVLGLERRSDGAAHWARDVYDEMAALQRDAGMRRLALVAESDGGVIGFVAGRVLLGEAELENIFVAADFQRQGIARALLAALAESCREAGAEELRLEVRERNEAARNFYQGAGFVISGRRRGYYLEPEEDALLLLLKL